MHTPVYGTMRQSIEEQNEPRGVYLTPGRLSKKGFPLWYAVGSDGREVGRAQQLPGLSASDVKRYLQWLLDRDDPVEPERPKLELMKPTPASAPRQLTVEELDRIYRDAHPVSALLALRNRERSRGAAPFPMRPR